MPNSHKTDLGSLTARERYSRLLYQSGGSPMVLTGLITGTLAYLLRHRLQVLLKKKEINA
ncbi:MAG: hypothetical protein QMC48_05805 [SAR324 cluster bacterium]